ncbi:MAG: thiamine pyrophosphate-binding protein [Halobacteriales archaeon]
MTEAASLVVDALEEYGVQRVFGNPGTTELPLMNAIPGSDLEYTLCLHEDVAVGAAAGYSTTMRYHDEMPLGFVNLHVAPGMAHGLGNLHGAYYSGCPLVVTAGTHSRDFEHEEPILKGDTVKMTEDYTKWSTEVRHPDAVADVIRRAVRTALSPPTGPVFVSLPMDVLREEVDDGVRPLGDVPRPGAPPEEAVEDAADVLAEASQPVLVLGDEVARSDAVDDAVALAEASGARVHMEMFAGEASYPTPHPQWVSFLPPKGGLSAMLLSVDCVVFAGCSTNTTLWKEDVDVVGEGTTCVELSADAGEIGKNYSSDVALQGDVGLAMSRLADAVESRVDDATLESRLDAVETAKKTVEAQITSMDPVDDDGDMPSKYDLVDAMHDVAPDAFVADEGVTAKFALLTRWTFDEGRYLGNKGGGLGYGLPAAVGAAVAHRDAGVDREVMAFVGDGSYFYYPQSIYTAVREDVDLSVVVPNNRGYRILKDNTVEIFGGEEDDYTFVGMDLPAVSVEGSARAYGAEATTVTERDGLRGALRSTVESDGVGVVDVHVPDV